MAVTRTLIIFFSFIICCSARQDGAPTSACSSLTPVHTGIQAQRREPPYSVSAVKNGNKVTVSISSPIGEEFEGFVVQARSSRDRSRLIDGRFTTSNVAKTIDCPGGKQNTLTHKNPSPKEEVITEWTPSSNVHEEVVFRATVAKTFALFWTQIDSPPVRIQSSGVSHMDRSQPERRGQNSMYNDCYGTSGCFGLPAGCVTREDCEVLLSYSRNFDGINFKMQGYLNPRVYMAMGLSTDAVMGDDSVTECYNENSRVYARTSYNEGKSNTRTRELSRGDYNGLYNNGLTTCSWTYKNLTQMHGNRYDLANNEYYVLLAKGNLRDNGNLAYHDSRIVSANGINFMAVEAIEDAGVSTSVKVHGTFMVTGWIGFVSLGILLARHFKNTWENSTLGGVKIWFALHRAFMITALVFVVIAFIIIFIHKNGWNYETKNPHAILGCIATALGLFQPIMAAFRPSPDNPKRPIFNWMHWTVGNAAQIIAVITIFFAVSLESSGLRESVYWVMAIFVIVHLLFHFLFQVHTWNSAKKKNNDLGMNEMAAGRTNNLAQSMQAKSVTENVFRILLLGIYGIFLLVILVALYALIGVA